MSRTAKFTLEKASGLARAGTFGAQPTPCALLTTQFGQPSHLIREPLAQLPFPGTATAAVRYAHMHEMVDSLKASGHNLSDYCHLQGRATLVTLRDPGEAAGKAESTDDSISFAMASGRRKLPVQEYTRCVAAMQPTIAVAAHDEVPLASGKNRMKASVSRTLAWLHLCLEAWAGVPAPAGATTVAHSKAKAPAPAAAPAAASDADADGAADALASAPAAKVRRVAEASGSVRDGVVTAAATDAASAPRSHAGGDAAAAAGGAAATPATSASASVVVPAPAPGTSILAVLPCVKEAPLRNRAIESIVAAAAAANAGASCTAAAAVDGAAAAAAAGAVVPVVPGFVIAGLGLGESPADRAETLADVLPRLPAGGVRLLPGVGDPLAVLDAVASGVDVFDSSFVEETTSKGHALAFPYAITPQALAAWVASNPAPVAAPVAADVAAAAASVADAAMTGGASTTAAAGGSTTSSSSSAAAATSRLVLDLTDKKHRLDTTVIVSGCTCMTCGGTGGDADVAHLAAGRGAGVDRRPVVFPGHHRAYIHHLLDCKEMLASVLLQAHNVVHYAAFFAAVRAHIVGGTFDDFRRWFAAVNA